MGNRFCFCCCDPDWCACDPSIRLKMWFTLEYYRDHAEDTRPTFWEKCDGMLGLNGTYEHIFDRNEGDCSYLYTQNGPVLDMAEIEWSAYYSPTVTSVMQTAQFCVTGSGTSKFIQVNFPTNYNKKYTVTPRPQKHQICRDGVPYWVWDYDPPGGPDTVIASTADTLHLRYEQSDGLGPLCLIDTFYQFIQV